MADRSRPGLRRAAALIAFSVLSAFCAFAARADQVRVAVASNFAAPMQRIAEAFARDSGHHALLSFGATGKFVAQIANGAPFDVFLSADQESALRLERESLAVANSRFTYAVGTLVLWSATPGTVDAAGEVLKTGDFKHLAIANAKTAPYGSAAVEVLKTLGLFDRLAPRLVHGENIAQTQQFVATGNAELGFVALAQVLRDGKIGSGSAWIVPAGLHAPLRQDAVLLARGRGNPAATALLDYLKSDAARALIRAHGYAL